MPPRRIGSISVVVVFSSRLNFSGGPEPPSPAARLLPGPDMAAAAGAVQGLPGTPGRRRRHFRHLQKTETQMWTRPGLRGPNPSPHIPAASRPRRPGPHLQRDQPSAAILDFARRRPASPARSAGAGGNAGCGGTALPVSMGCALSRLSGFFRTSLFLRDWPVDVPIVTDTTAHASLRRHRPFIRNFGAARGALQFITHALSLLIDENITLPVLSPAALATVG